MKSMDGKVALITGGADGIGRATARRLSAMGCKIVIADVDEQRAHETLALIKKDGGEAQFIATDVSRPDEVRRMVDFAVDTFKRLDVLFNNAGIASATPFLEHDPDVDFKRVLDVNLFGAYHGVLNAARVMKKLGNGGVIINTTSGYAFMAPSNLLGYHVSKTALLALSKAAALELADQNIRVLSLVPGWTDTKLVTSTIEAGLLPNIERETLRRRLLTVEEVANVVGFMASPEASAMNGVAVHADDGYATFKYHWD